MAVDGASVGDLRRVPLGGTGANLVADANGLLYLLADEGRQAGRRVACFDHWGALLWERRYPSASYPTVSVRPLRVSPDGVLWLGSDQRIYQVVAPTESDPRPVELSSLLRSDEGEHLGTFVVLPDGFLVCLDHPANAPRPPSLTPRVSRLDRDGAVQWCTALPVEAGSFAGDRVRHHGPVLPRTWSVDYVSNPLLVLGRRVLVSLCEIGSGAGSSYCLDAETGKLVWKVDTYCTASHGFGGPDSFLMSRRGAGLARFNANGEVRQQWPTTGYCLVASDPNDVICVLPQHGGPGPAYFSHLTADGEVRRGTRLAARFYTSYPALTASGETVFWHAGALHLVDRRLESQILINGGTLADEPGAWFSRLLLLRDGTLACTMSLYKDDVFSAELVLLRSKLRPGTGWWPCGDGNLGGNPLSAASP